MPKTDSPDRKLAGKRLTQKAVRAARALEPVPHPGLPFGSGHHVFITKAKRGELWALNHLSVEARAAITPLFEMWPPKPTKTLEGHAADLLQMIKAEWGVLPFFLDTRYVPLGGVPSPASAKIIFDVARTKQLQVVPTTSLRFAPAYQQAIRDVISADKRGVLIRLAIPDFINPGLLSGYLTGLLTVLQVRAGQTDILIDLEHRPEQIEVQQLGASAMSVLPFLNDWRTVTLAAGCFPESISNVPHQTWTPVPRGDWLGWLHVSSSQGGWEDESLAMGTTE
jgi:hypothetical protein